MKYLLGSVATLGLLLGTAAAIVFAGGYNVAATDQHFGLTRWFLATTMRHSVAARAATVNAPMQFTGKQVADGFSEFDGMCVACHGAPGVERGEVGKGLNPRPPDLAKASESWSTAELFWIVKHGVKMTGMPAFGPTHSDERLWTIVAFLKQLPRLSSQDYEKMKGSLAKGHHDAHEHSNMHDEMPDPK